MQVSEDNYFVDIMLSSDGNFKIDEYCKVKCFFYKTILFLMYGDIIYKE